MLSNRFQRGVTLIEMVIVLVLIAVLLMLVVPAARDWLVNSRIRTATESMLAGIQLARAEAVRRNSFVEFVLDDVAKSGWTVRTASAEEITKRPAEEGTADVVVTVTPANANIVTFDGLGRRVPNADTSNSLERVDLDLLTSVLPADKSRDLRILIGVGGLILMCDPTVTDTADIRKCP